MKAWWTPSRIRALNASTALVTQPGVMVPGPAMSASVTVMPAGRVTNGRTFQPCPRSTDAALWGRSGSAGSGTARHASPLRPVGFSGDTWRETTPVSVGSPARSPCGSKTFVIP